MRIRNPKLRRLARDEDGVVAVEAALVVPFLVVLGFGLFEFGNMFYNMQLIQTGVRDAARYLARVEDPRAVEAAARTLAVTGTIDSSRGPRVKDWATGDVAIAYETTANPPDATTGLRQFRAGDSVTVIRVTTTFAYRGFGLLSVAGLDEIRITAAHEERHVGR